MACCGFFYKTAIPFPNFNDVTFWDGLRECLTQTLAPYLRIGKLCHMITTRRILSVYLSDDDEVTQVR